MFKNIKTFIANLQKSDEPVKKRWLIVFTATSSLLVVLVWMMYISAGMSSITASADKEIINKPGFLQTITENSVIGLTNSFVFFRNKLQTANSFIITKGNQNFIWDDLEEMPRRQLP